MKKSTKQSALEQTVYAAIWLLIWCAPIANFMTRTKQQVPGLSFWDEVSGAWIISLPFFLLFLVNNYILLPRLMLKKRYAGYVLALAVSLILLFHFVPECVKIVSAPTSEREVPFNTPPAYDLHPEEEDFRMEDDRRPPMHHQHRDNPKPPFAKPLAPPMITFINIIVAILLVGFNLTVKLFLKSLHDEEVLRDMRHQQLESELQYLKNQLNPHFFMNTLNNIHALVDIDREKAKDTIIELSKLMRYVLYESNTETVKLEKEIQFLKNYITLMRLRYTDKLEVRAEFPLIVPDVSVPPLLFISLIENAFKHGVSYKGDSYIHISMKTEDDKTVFSCHNSKHVKNHSDTSHGIGLENVKKRLRLLFGNNYTYTVDDGKDYYNVLLIIPFL